MNVSSAKSMQCNRLLGQQQRLFLTFFFLGLINNVLYMHKIVFILLSNISNIDWIKRSKKGTKIYKEMRERERERGNEL